jgi:hypothetical protein
VGSLKIEVIVHFNYFWNFRVFLATQPQDVLLHRFPPVKPCANENFPYPLVIELSRPEICHLVGVREDGTQSDESIFRKIGVFNRLKIS